MGIPLLLEFFYEKIKKSKKLKINQTRKEQKTMSKQENFLQDTLLWIDKMLIDNEIHIKDVPYRIRLTLPSIYIMAFRASRSISSHRYVGDMWVLYNDILCAKVPQREELLDYLNRTMDWLKCNSKDDFYAFQADMDKEILQELQRKGRDYAAIVKCQLQDKNTANANNIVSTTDEMQ